MTGRPYSLFHSIFQIIAASRFGTWFFSHTARQVDGFFLKLSRGRTSLTHILAGLPVIVLTTIGAKSGLPRTLPLAFIRDPSNPDQFAVVASNFGNLHHPAWYYNLKAHPQVSGAINGQVKTYFAHEASGDEYTRFWRYASETYKGFPVYKRLAKTRVIPIMVLTPDTPS